MTTPKPAPAPEPKGSEDVEAEITVRVTENGKVQSVAAWERRAVMPVQAQGVRYAQYVPKTAYLALRAELAQVREEIAKKDANAVKGYLELENRIATERAAREKAEKEWDYFDRRATKAEARVKELSEAAQAVVDVRPDLPNTLRGEIETLATILARAKEGEKR